MKSIIVQCHKCKNRFKTSIKIINRRMNCPACNAGWNIKQYKLINLEQGTNEWLKWRRKGIGASDAASIMGENPWKSEKYLMREKIEGTVTRPNDRMLRGQMLEPEARKIFIKKCEMNFMPVCVEHRIHPWLRASLDGLSPCGRFVVEIKCGESAYKKTEKYRKVPGYYYGQLQHILAVTGLKKIEFWCYLPNRPGIHLRINRDESYIGKMIKEEYRFWKEVEELI